MTVTIGSLFDGIGGFPLAFGRAGFQVSWSVEIDRDCQRVLTRHWPDVPKHLDVRDVGKHNLAPVDVITFGSPCQDLSVAGNRSGLDGARSNLFYEAIRICDELKPTFALWENVPGAFSSNAGRDFASVLLAFRELGARDICWRVLDAQHFGVPQRRRRIFLVADFGGERAAEILLEPEGVSGDIEKSRKERARLATDIAASLKHGGGNGRGCNLDAESGLVATAPTLSRRNSYDRGDGAEPLVVQPVVSTLQGGGKRGQRIDAESAAGGHKVPTVRDDIARCKTSRNERIDYETETFVAECATGDCTHAITRSAYKGSSEDGTGRGTPIVAFSSKDYGADASEDVSPTLRSMEFDQSHMNGGGQVAIAFGIDGSDTGFALRANPSHSGDKGDGGINTTLAVDLQNTRLGSDQAGTLDTTRPTRGGGQAVLSFAQNQRGELRTSEISPQLTTGGGKPGEGYSAALSSLGVRRLTPRECERLQGFPDDWTVRDAAGKPIADSARYRMLGNSVAVPVVEWIADRMKAVMVREEAS